MPKTFSTYSLAKRLPRAGGHLQAFEAKQSGLDRDVCDAVLYVEAAREQRLARALGRGLSQDQFEKREAAQLPEDAKRARAGLTVDNNGTSADLERVISGLWPELCMRKQGGQPVYPCANPTETKLPSRQP